MSYLSPSRSRVVSSARRLVRSARRVIPGAAALPEIKVQTRRQALEGYVICLELGEATVVAEGNVFAFQVPEGDLRIGQPVRFIRTGDGFELV
ncbi:MAG: hypothetical protein ACO1SV_18545 [Fimbriimonas sp.]